MMPRGEALTQALDEADKVLVVLSIIAQRTLNLGDGECLHVCATIVGACACVVNSGVSGVSSLCVHVGCTCMCQFHGCVVVCVHVRTEIHIIFCFMNIYYMTIAMRPHYNCTQELTRTTVMGTGLVAFTASTKLRVSL